MIVLNRLSAKGVPTWLVLLFVVVTLAYAVLLPPFSQRDETAHFTNTARVALASPIAREGEHRGALVPAPLAELLHIWPYAMEMAQFHPFPVARLTDELFRPFPANPGLAFATTTFGGSYPPTLYLPQAGGLWLAHSLGLPALMQFYAGRLAAGIAAIVAVIAAVLVLPFGGRAFFAVAMLPGAGSTLATFSADATILPISFLAMAVVLRAGLDRGGVAMLLLLPPLVLAKGTYAPIALAGLAEGRRWNRTTLLWLGGSIALGVVVFVAWFGWLSPSEINQQTYVNPLTLQRMTSAHPRDQVAFMLSHPGHVAWAVVRAMVERLPAYGVDAIGRFGWSLILLPWPLYGVAFVMLAASLPVFAQDDAPPSPWQRVWWLTLFLAVVVLVHLALYVIHNALGESSVVGVQGRYFLPAMPLLLLAFRFRAPGPVARVARWLWSGAGAALMLGSAWTAGSTFWEW